jgi:hypothetical protein
MTAKNHAEWVERHSRRWESEKQRQPRENDHGADRDQRDPSLQALLH